MSSTAVMCPDSLLILVLYKLFVYLLNFLPYFLLIFTAYSCQITEGNLKLDSNWNKSALYETDGRLFATDISTKFKVKSRDTKTRTNIKIRHDQIYIL